MATTSYATETKLQLLRRIASMEAIIDQLIVESNATPTQAQAPDAIAEEECSQAAVLCDFWESSRSFDRLDFCREVVKGLGKQDAQAFIDDILSVI